jgi:hypothetical protein
MKTHLRVVWTAILAAAACAQASDPILPGDEITAVSSKVFNGYKRALLADGSFRPERYGFAIGGNFSRIPAGLEQSQPEPTRDDTIDGIRFAAIAQSIEGPLAAQKYMGTGEPGMADLLIVVFWGRSIGSGAFAQSQTAQISAGSDQDKVDAQNAHLLGFDSSRVFDQGFDDPTNMMSKIRKQVHSGVIDAVKEDRYFVILQAFDFQAAWKRGKVNLLWETRFSLNQRHHDFQKDLPRMAQVASQYFGQDSHGLVYRAIPAGRVDIGEVKSLGEVGEKPGPGAPQAPAKP